MTITLCFALYLFAGDATPVWRHCYATGPGGTLCAVNACRRNPGLCEWLTCPEDVCGERREILEWTLTGRRDP